jgi:pilus assembly protein CpaB
LKISKNTALLGAAVALGVLCFIGARYYLRDYLAQAESKLVGNYKTKKVIVAAVDIPAGGTLSADNLAVRTIPERYLASTAMNPDTLDTVTGQKIMVAVKPGDPIDRGALERSDRAALSTTIAKGERAITFPVDEISSMSGMLVPGDIIDLLYTGPGTTANSYGAANKAATDGNTGPKELLHVRPILQAVTVMATGKTTQKRMVRTENGGQQEVNMDFSTVTLKVNSSQAQQVLIAQKLGQLTAVLRNPEDKSRLGKMVLDETTFKQVERPPAAGMRNYVEMIIGGSGTAGGTKTQTEVGRNAMVDMLGRMPQAAPAEKPQPSALDVKSRLGLNPPPPAKQNNFLNTTTR